MGCLVGSFISVEFLFRKGLAGSRGVYIINLVRFQTSFGFKPLTMRSSTKAVIWIPLCCCIVGHSCRRVFSVSGHGEPYALRAALYFLLGDSDDALILMSTTPFQ